MSNLYSILLLLLKSNNKTCIKLCNKFITKEILRPFFEKCYEEYVPISKRSSEINNIF